MRGLANLMFVRTLTALMLAAVLTASIGPVSAQGRPADASRIATVPEFSQISSLVRVEKTPVAGGSEIITIFVKPEQGEQTQGPLADIPLVSVLRDTLGDENPENDRLRYVWMLTYTKPTFTQKLSSVIPFLYTRTTNKDKVGTDPPPAIIDLNASDKKMWNRVFWMVFKRLVFDGAGVGLRAATLQYRQNKNDYRRSAIAAAMTVLSLYHEVEGEKVLSERELQDIQARLSLTGQTFGWMMQTENLGRVYDKEITKVRDYRGHNWELLRQYCEAQSLFFEPLEMPDGTARHAIVWASASDIKANKGRKFDRRFLNIKSPWDDKRLDNWDGYSEVRWYDADDRRVDAETPGAHPRTMIPLAIYGLDHPKVPVILVDFRDSRNPKMREISRRVLNDLTGNVLSLSLGGMPFVVGRFVYDFVTGRRGADLNQSTRVRSYAQLKLLMSLDMSLDPEFRRDVTELVESSTLNPMQNDADVEAKIAKAQYANLMAYANRPDGLSRRISDDRREEMTRLKHGAGSRAMFALGHLVSFGLYTHREDESMELLAELNIRRRLEFHERLIREVAFRTADPAVDTELADLRRSLAFIAQNGAAAQEKTTRALAKIFAVSSDESIQQACLTGLYRINSSAAKKQLLAIYRDSVVKERWRNVSAEYLKLALQEGQRISNQDARVIKTISSN